MQAFGEDFSVLAGSAMEDNVSKNSILRNIHINSENWP